MEYKDKLNLIIEHIRLMKYYKLSVLEEQCGIPHGHLSKQLNGKDFMKERHINKLYNYLLETSFKG